MSAIQDSFFDESDVVASILASHYIVDYGYISAVNPDGTVNVVHARKPRMYNGEELSETVTQNIEVLTIAGAGFSLKWDYKEKDRVLLLGLKDYIEKVDSVEQAESNTVFLHYSRETLKAIPLCVFDDSAKVRFEIEKGKLTTESEKETAINASKIELNGNSKQFVTWAELNSALQNFVTTLGNHTHSNGNQGSPTGPMIIPPTLDISSAKTSTIVTGG